MFSGGMGDPSLTTFSPAECLVGGIFIGLIQSLLVVLAAAGGWLAGRFVVRFMREADEREHRFQRLLQIPADAYWELDPHYALQDLSPGRGPVDAVAAEALLGYLRRLSPGLRADVTTL